ncbi:MAG: hypothetical protein JWQ91_1176 [Aeromicrobium sp.]|uniref:hypothetical protein n=1 Tax=Aeromicrobium sp. TaxID=1871063 RepID=UPI00260C4029|nr:hypothetical protein [Aeromicrobium sp.]MCW2824259.1 hypothetical protein [Aeromicrobium sp.]
MSLRPQAALVALLVGLLAPAAPAAAAVDDPAASTATVAVEGTVARAEIDHFGDDPSSASVYAVRLDDGLLVPVTSRRALPADGQFSGELVIRGAVARELESRDLLPDAGSTVDQESKAGSAALAVAVAESLPMPVVDATVIPAGDTGATVTPSAHRAYVVKMTDQGSVDGDDASIGAAVDAMLSYWVTESDGGISSFGRVGPILGYDSAADYTPSQGCGLNDPFTIWNDALTLFPSVNFDDPGNHLIVLVGEECGHAGPVGVATIGSSLASGGPSILTYDPQTFRSTGAHELGHNFGLLHANLDTCAGPTICEYFDLYSPMGLSIGGTAFTPPALGTLYRAELGLTTSAEVSTVELASGETSLTQSFDLAPRSAATGLRGLLVTDPSTGITYSIDSRARTGRDAGAFYGSAYSLGSPAPTYPTGVVVERQAGLDATYLMTTTGPFVEGTTPRQVGAHGVGNSFSPSPQLKVTVNSIGATTKVTVELGQPQVTSAAPGISGMVKVGETVSATTNGWSVGTSFAYDWRVDDVSTGQTGSSFDIPGSAVGKTLTVKVTGSKAGYASATRDSAGSPVGPGTLSSSAAPGIAGTSSPGRAVTVSPGAWTSGATLAYDWRLDDVSTGAVDATFTIPATAGGKSLTVRVTGTKPGYTSLMKESSPVTVGLGTLTSGAPTISGAVRVAETVSAMTSGWTSGTSFTYDWRLDDVSTGQTGPSYAVPASADGKKLTVTVTGSKAGYVAVARESVASTVAKGILVAKTPTISGTAKVGRTLTAAAGTWTSGTALTYRWYAGTTAITKSSTSRTYKIAKAYKGKKLTVKVTGKKVGYTTVTRTSKATRAVAR